MLMQDVKAFAPAQKIDLPRVFRRTAATKTGGGMLAGTLVATADGWHAAGSLTPGMQVETWDGGLCRIASVIHQRLLPESDLRIIHVPGGSFGCCSDLWLAADQTVLMVSPLIEAVLGTAGALIRAGDLAGHGAVRACVVVQPVTMVSLAFARPEFAYVNTGFLVECRPGPALTNDGYLPRLTAAQAGALLERIAPQSRSFHQVA